MENLRVFIIGNGNSRKNFNLKLLDNEITFGANALYRNYSPTHLYVQDSGITHEVISSEYNGNIMVNNLIRFSGDDYPQMKMTIPNSIENESNQFFYLHGTDDFYISWFSDERNITEYHIPEIEYGCNAGISMIYISMKIYNPQKIYLLGFDVFGERNNIYDGTSCYENLKINDLDNEWNNNYHLFDGVDIIRVIDNDTILKNTNNMSYNDFFEVINNE